MMKPFAPIPTTIRARAPALQALHHLPHPTTPNTIAIAIATANYHRNGQTRRASSSSTTTDPSSRRRAVTPFNDTGQVPWSSLSAAEKAGRAAQQSFNLGIIVVGAVMAGGVAYFLWGDVFSPDSKTAHFNRAFDRIKSDPRCTALLGPGKELLAHGDETYNKWRRARPIQSTEKKDRLGHTHLIMHFYVEGPRNRATVGIHLIKNPNMTGDFRYKYFYVDVPGEERIYLENADAKKPNSQSGREKKFKFLGVTWG